MNILFFITPKNEVAHIKSSDSLEDALCKMERFQYTAVPIIDEDGKYIGTITEGDALWYIRHYKLWEKDLKEVSILKVNRRVDNQPVSVNVNMEDLVAASMEQNFVPVMDDDQTFIGIVKRKDIIEYCFKHMKKK